MTRDDLDTPCVVIDRAKADANLRRAQDHADAHGVNLRPHIKTHKLPLFAEAQIALGAVGITCQKLGEAEVMAAAGIDDIFLPYNILGASKLIRLKALNDRITLCVTADNAETVAGYAETFAGDGKALKVLVECDTGLGRCGVQTPEDAVTLARQIAEAPGLRFGGLMTYPAAGGHDTAEAWLKEAVALLDTAGLKPETVSSGGTPDLWRAPDSIVTEYRPGTYIYFDRDQVRKGAAEYDDCALTVLTTVVSRPTESRAVIDAGSKALTSDLLGLDGYGYIPDYPEAKIVMLSEEHGMIDLSDCTEKPGVGARIHIVPNHACPVSNLYDAVYLVSGNGNVEAAAVAARGRVD